MKLPPLPDFSQWAARLKQGLAKIPPVSQWPRQRLAVAGLAGVGLVAVIGGAVALGGQPRTATPESATRETATAETATAETAETAAPVATLLPSDSPTILSETADAGRSYIDETLFLGDSNTARYLLYADDTGSAFTTLANNIGVVSMGAESIASLQCEQFSGYSRMYTMPEAVAMLKPRRIIICFGTNNLSGSSTDATNFIATYLKGLQAIEEAWPYCDIIVSAIPPLDYQRENTNLTMTQVDAYNAAIAVMCEENGYYFLNSTEVLKDETTGWAKTDYTLSDGVHLSKVAVTAYFDYVRTHALLTEDRRPDDLGTIPTPVGPPVNLISEDPIAVRGQAAKVPVEFVCTNGGSLSGSTSQLVAKGGTSSAVTAVAKSGFKFAGWTISTGGSSSSATISVTVPSNANAGGVVATATFVADEHEHNYVEIEGTAVPATCLVGGSAKYSCTICGQVIEQDTPALGHLWDDGVRDGDVIVYTCTREGCGATKTEQAEHIHEYTTLVKRIDATCTEPEWLVYACSCGEQITQQGTVAALGHVPVTQADGSVICSRCSAPLQAAPTPTTAPTPLPTTPPAPTSTPEPPPAQPTTSPVDQTPTTEPTPDTGSGNENSSGGTETVPQPTGPEDTGSDATTPPTNAETPPETNTETNSTESVVTNDTATVETNDETVPPPA